MLLVATSILKGDSQVLSHAARERYLVYNLINCLQYRIALQGHLHIPLINTYRIGQASITKIVVYPQAVKKLCVHLEVLINLLFLYQFEVVGVNIIF